MMRVIGGLAIALAVAAGPAAADDTYDACFEASDGSNAAWAQCGGAYVERVDAKLNAVWKQLFKAVEGETKTHLLAEQRAWIAFKETACRLYELDEWGREGQVLHGPLCAARVIEDRIKSLEDYQSIIAN